MSLNDLIRSNIQNLLKLKGLTYSEVGRQMGVTCQSVSQKLKGQRPIFIHELNKLAEILDVDPIIFFNKSEVLK